MRPQHTSPSPLTGPSLAPSSGGQAKNLVILLHGFGASGDDLIELAKSWQGLLPDTEFIAPNAPTPCPLSPFGHSYQWFALEDMNPATMQKGVADALPTLNDYIDQELKNRNLTDAQLVLAGFSQGTMMALATGVSRSHTCAGVLGYSGAFICPPDLSIRSQPPIFLIHGDADDIIEVEHGMQAAADLSELGVPVRSFVAKEVGHYIDPQGHQLGGEFIYDLFTTNKKETTE